MNYISNGKIASFVKGFVNEFLMVCTVAVRATPSEPNWTSRTRPKVH